MAGLFLFLVTVIWAVESKRGNGIFLQPIKIYSILGVIFPLIVCFLGYRFHQSIAYKKETGGIFQVFCCKINALISILSFIVLLLGMAILLHLLEGGDSIRE